MYRLLFALSAVWLFAAEVLGADSRENYLPNPGFEEGAKFWELPKFPVGEAAIDDAVSHSGKRSLRLRYHADADARLYPYLFAYNPMAAVLIPGREYTFSGWIKIAGVPPGKSGPIACLSEAHADRGSSPPLSGNTDPSKNDGWVFVSFRYTAPKNVDAHQFRCVCRAAPDGMAGTVWFDDLKLEEGDQPSTFRPDWIDPSELYSREPTIPWFPLPPDYRSSLEVVTPHIELARPYAGGTLRMLWAGFYNNARVPCELAERGDLTPDSVALNGSSVDVAGVRTLHAKCVEVFRARLGVGERRDPAEPGLQHVGPSGDASKAKQEQGPEAAASPGTAAAEPASLALRASEPAPQVLVIEQGTLELLNQQDRAMIVERIGEGMGCVVLLGPIHVAGHPGAVVTPKIQELISAAEKLPQPGRGRVVTALNVQQHPLWSRGTLGIETVYSDILKAIYRSVEKRSAVVTAAVRPRQPVANMPWTASAYGRGSSATFRVFSDASAADASLMDGYGTSSPRTLVAVAAASTARAAAGEVRCAMRPLPGGNYMLLVQMLNQRKEVLGWSLVPFTVASPVEIAKLDAGREAFEPQQPLHVACTIANHDRPLANARLVAQLDDPRGRILYFSSTPLAVARGETTHDLVLKLAHAERCAVRLQVQVVAGDLVQARRTLWLSSEQLMPKVDFHVGPYDDFNEGWSMLGADMVVGSPRPELGLRPFPWLDLPRALGADASVCDPRSLDKAAQYVNSSLAAAGPWTTLGCILHDEINDLGFSDPPTRHDVEFFRRYLQETYQDLKSLNVSWGSNYSNWDQIDVESTKISFVTQTARSPAPRADWYAASEQAAHRFYAALDEHVRRECPGARIGPGGTRETTGNNGIDWWLLAHDFRCVCLYHGLHDELYRSFAPDGRLMANWLHPGDAQDDPDWLRVRIWQDVFAQCGGAPVYGGRYTNVFFPDYRPKAGLLAYAAELASIRDGFGRLILGARRNDAAAAVFYSPACYRARMVVKKEDSHYNSADEQNDLLAAISAALADLRIGSRFVAYEQVARGELDPRSTRALFLWGALALSDAEAAAIRRYLDTGGIVIADSEPGLYDEHCRRRAAGALHNCLPPQGSLARQVGKGKFILYGALGQDYVKTRGYGYDGTAEPTAADLARRTSAKLRAMLAKEAGLEGDFRLCDEHGRDFDCALTAMDFRDGQARYVGCVPNGTYGRTLNARLTIPAAGNVSGTLRSPAEIGTRSVPDTLATGHLYDCRAGKYLGTATDHDVVLREATGNLFALLPYRVQRLDIAAPARAVLGQAIEAKATLAADETAKGTIPFVRHVVVFQLQRPDGRKLPENRWIVETNNGVAACRMYLALNDPQGNWTLIARDVATGVRQTATVEIQPSVSH